MAQPIIRGIQAVGNVDILYRFNGGVLQAPPGWGSNAKNIDATNDLKVAGIRLDGEFIRAAQQIASSVMIPLLGGGGVALTNNNRTGTLTISCTKSSSPNISGNMNMTGRNVTGDVYGAGLFSLNNEDVYDMVILAQYQQGCLGGDSYGSTITVVFDFNGMGVELMFMGCTIAQVTPVVLSGNDAANYQVEVNYLDWVCNFYEESKASNSI